MTETRRWVRQGTETRRGSASLTYHGHWAVCAAGLHQLHWWPGRCISQNPPVLPLWPSAFCLPTPAVADTRANTHRTQRLLITPKYVLHVGRICQFVNLGEKRFAVATKLQVQSWKQQNISTSVRDTSRNWQLMANGCTVKFGGKGSPVWGSSR